MRAPGLQLRASTAWVLLVLWCASIFVLSAQSSLRIAPDPNLDWILRKSAHALVFGVLAVLAERALTASSVPRPAWLAFVLAVVYAASDELHQGFVGGRTASLTDVMVDAVGAVAALVLWHRVLAWRLGATAR